MTSQQVTFDNSNGIPLSGVLQLPATTPVAYGLFAHCFTCTKSIAAASRIAASLAQRGIGILRFDFTGLGKSGGDFSDTNFSTNISDLVDAAGYLRERYQPPALLVGHSLGGAAVLASAAQIPEVVGVVTIGAPAEPSHVARQFQREIENIRMSGSVDLQLAGRPFTIKRQFLEDIESHDLSRCIAHLRKALLIFHAPTDETVPISEAAAIYQTARHPKSFISLDSGDHLLTAAADAEYVGAVVSSWASRYLMQTTEALVD